MSEWELTFEEVADICERNALRNWESMIVSAEARKLAKWALEANSLSEMEQRLLEVLDETD